MQQVGIVILNYNNTQDIKECINSVLKYTPIDIAKYVIVDNGSNECVKEEIHRFLSKTTESYQCISEKGANVLKKITYICLPKNIGYACGNNVGINFLCQFDDISHIMILNSDILFTQDIITILLEKIKRLKDVGSISPLLFNVQGDIEHCCARKNYPINTLRHTFSYLFSKKYSQTCKKQQIIRENPHLVNEDVVRIELPSGSCMLFEKKTLQDINGFDENTFLYYEENILFKKLQHIGKENYLIPSVSCIHKGGKTTNSTKTAYFLKKCNYNSLLYYMKTYEPNAMFSYVYIYISGLIVLGRLRCALIYKKIYNKLFYKKYIT